MKTTYVIFPFLTWAQFFVLAVAMSENLFGRQTDLPVSPTNRSEAKAALIPYPRRVKWLDQDHAVTSVLISMPGSGGEEFRFIDTTLRDILNDVGVKIIEKSSADADCAIRFKLVPVDNPRNSKEAYRLKVDEKVWSYK